MRKVNVMDVKVKDIIPYERNAKKHPPEQIEQIATSIQKFGWAQPLVIDRDNTIIIGHGRLEAAKFLGEEQVPCVVIDDLTPEEIRVLRIADNKLNESEWDMELLEDELRELGEENVDWLDLSDLDIDWGDEEDYGMGGEPDEQDEPHILTEDFIVPPFSVLDGRSGYWQKRESKWKELIKDEGDRGDAHLFPVNAFKGEGYKGRNKTVKNISVLDPVLAEVICRWFVPDIQGAKCCDPFAGDTAFGFVSSYLGAEFTGIELRQKQADFNNGRMEEYNFPSKYFCDDGRNIKDHIPPESMDLLFSCPPYFNLEVYSDLENDASNQGTYEEFYEILDTAFTNAITCLKQNRFAVIVVGDVRNSQNGEYYNFPNDIVKTFQRSGMSFYNSLILLDPVATAALRARRNMHTRKVVKVHQNVLVFYKGDTGHIKDYFPEITFNEGTFEDESGDV